MSRFADTAARKRTGATFTPQWLAEALATRLVEHWQVPTLRRTRVLEPAVGDGVLVEALLRACAAAGIPTPEIHAWDTDEDALNQARRRLLLLAPDIQLHHGDFLAADTAPFDLVIANPPWVRTQVLGRDRAQEVAARFGLGGRVDLSHAFVARTLEVLAPGGIAGLWLSNKLLSTRGAGALRSVLLDRVSILDIWDLGDTRQFDAAVLPAALVFTANKVSRPARYVRCQRIASPAPCPPLDLLHPRPGPARMPDDHGVHVEVGELSGAVGRGVWRLETPASRQWLAQVAAHSKGCFGDLGPVKVGVKSTADKVFVRNDWATCTPAMPELLRPLTTHRSAHPIRARHPVPAWQILYPHETVDGARRPVDLDPHPASRAWLEAHEARLRGRTYVQEAGRAWYALWVPHAPDGWAGPKLVCRDIAAHPCMWVDLEGTVVNGDCYWIPVADVDDPRMWAAVAIGCSHFALAWYDRRFGNRLYAGRRRFLTQYIQHFPLPADPRALSDLAHAARQLYGKLADENASVDDDLKALDRDVWRAFGVEPT